MVLIYRGLEWLMDIPFRWLGRLMQADHEHVLAGYRPASSDAERPAP